MNVKRGLAFGLLLCFRSSHFHLILSIRPSILCGLFLVYHVTVLFQFTCLRVSGNSLEMLASVLYFVVEEECVLSSS